MPLYSMMNLMRPCAKTLRTLPATAGAASMALVRKGGVVRSILDQGVKPLPMAVRDNDSYEKFTRARVVNFNFYASPDGLKAAMSAWKDGFGVLRVNLKKEKYAGSADLEQRCLLRMPGADEMPTLRDFARGGGLAGLDGDGGATLFEDPAEDRARIERGRKAKAQSDFDHAVRARMKKLTSLK